MMETNIIAIRKQDVQRANEAFSSLMQKTENCLNERSLENPDWYKNLTAKGLEKESHDVIKLSCVDTPFNPDEVILVSGQKFPDIIADKYYGVEVKSTNKDHWKSTGSSIVESTRDEYVENIYMLFGKLGGNPPQFKCRPYEDVLYDIAVTHSPRYLIDMELDKGSTIFSKMNTSYNEFRTSTETIDIARRYYQEKAKREKKQEMPWWLTSTNADAPRPMNIRMWNALSAEERQRLLAMCLILFPETLSPRQSPTKFNQSAMWLCSYYQVVVPNIRDLFTAGGKITTVNGKKWGGRASQIFKTIVDYSSVVKQLLQYPTEETLALIEEFNPSLFGVGCMANADLYGRWLELCDQIGREFNVPILEWIKNESKLK